MIARGVMTIQLRGPVLTRSSSVGRMGVDAPAARKLDGTLYIPGTLVLGRIRDAFRTLGELDPAYEEARARWFGDGDDLSVGRPKRRRLFIGDLEIKANPTNATRSRVAVDPISHAVLEGALLVLDAPFGIDAQVRCEGEVRALGTTADIDKLWPMLRKALAWITQLGSLRTVGYGVVVHNTIGDPVQALPPIRTQPAARLRIVLTVRDPLCVGETRNDRNSFISSDVIPGGAIKGALASLILSDTTSNPRATVEATDTTKLGRYFSALRFTHAFPVEKIDPDRGQTRRPSRVPYSWVTAPNVDPNGNRLKGETFYDAALANNPAAAQLVNGAAPKFAPSWKDEDTEARRLVGWSSPPTELRVRTAIDPHTRAARANQLFAIEYRVPTDHVWVGDIDLSDIPAADRATVVQRLDQHLSAGLLGLGRSGSDAGVTLTPLTTAESDPKLDSLGRLVLVLQSPALLRNPTIQGDVTHAYREAFHDLAPNPGLKLVAVFVRERLSGADFMARRFFGPDRPYRPYLLTEPGSTFVFAVDPDRKTEAIRTVAAWERQGLNIPTPALQAYDLLGVEPLWQFCPFVRQNGYGEVASHTRLVQDATPVRPLRGAGIEDLPPEPGEQGECP